MKPVRLCLLGDATSVHLQRWAREMAVRGFEINVVTARPAPMEGVAQQTVLPPVRRSLDWLWRVDATRNALRSLQPGLVHAHYVTSYGYLAARTVPALQRPLVMTAWGSDLLVTPGTSPLHRALTGWTLRRADCVTGDSADLLTAARAYKLREQPLLIHFGVDLARFAPAPWDAKPRFDVVSLRAWEPNYRIGAIVQAVALLRERQPAMPVHLHVLGGGSQHSELMQQVAALSLQDRVTLLGHCDDAGMARVLARCKVSVSVPASDATSVSVLESMAAGLAVVASDLPANRDWLGAASGMLIGGNNETLPTRIADTLATLWQDDAAAQRTAQANRARVETDGDRARQMDHMADVYRRLLRGRC
ncbi:MAG: glycosyltransferase [Pseudomonadota bacterium]|nr:glycosyltransferase [Pseudomonadota bacterium]